MPDALVNVQQHEHRLGSHNLPSWISPIPLEEVEGLLALTPGL